MKKTTISRFVQNTAIFFIGTIFSKLISFLLLPLYTSIVPTEEMGVLDVSITVATLLLSVCFFEIWSAVLRYLYDRDEEGEKNSVIFSGMKIFLISTVIFVAVNSLACWLLGYRYIYWIVAYGFAYAASNYFTFAARGLGLNKDFAVSGVINTLVHLTANIVLLVLVKMNYSALYVSFVLGAAAQVIYLMIRIDFVRRMRTVEKNVTLTYEMLRYALPLCLNTVAYWALSSSNRLVYNWMYGDAASGVFSIGSRFGSIIALATTCFTYAWQDLAFSATHNDKEGAAKLYVTACSKYQQFLSAATVLILPAINVAFPILIKGEYKEAVSLVPYFVIVAVTSGYSAFIGNIFYAIKDTKVISISTMIAAAVNLAVCYPMIKYLGAVGANLAIILAFVVNIAIRAVILKKKVNFSIYISKILFSVIWITVTSVVYLFGGTLWQIILFVVNCAVAFLVFREDLLKIFKKKN
jgi:O-antigen/teichoic acid export membrane protein